MTKKMFSILSLLIVASMLLSACGGGGSEKPAEVKVLRVWIKWGDNPQQIQEMFDQYAKISGYKVEVTAPVDDDKVLPGLTGTEPPDILVLDAGDLVKSYSREGLVDELTQVIKDGNIDMNDFYTGPLNACKLGDKYLCLPWGFDVYALYWNKDLFEAAGLDPEKPPATMEELVEYADKLTKVGPDGKIEQIGFIPDQPWDHSDLYSRMFGGFWYNDDGTQLTVNSQPVVDAMTWQQKFYSKYDYENVLQFASGFGEYNSPDHPFFAGKLAMYVDGEWIAGPNYIPTFKPELNYGVAPFPPPADHPERANTAVAQGTVVVIPSGGKNKVEAAKLLAWMMSPDIVAAEFCRNANLPTSKKAAQDPCFNINPGFKVFVDLAASPNVYPLITTTLSLEINDAFGTASEEILHTGADPKATLDAIQTKYQDQIK
jgi:multiple sugar transport system substrate-binding protein